MFGRATITVGIGPHSSIIIIISSSSNITRMWANAQRDGRPAEHRWRPPFNTAKFG